MAAEDRDPHVLDSDDPIAVRRAKLDALRANGEEPYRLRYDVDARSAGLTEKYAGLADGEETSDTVHVAGRVVALRDQGKALFIVLRDATGDLQLFCRVNMLGEAAFAKVKDLDLGDWVGAEGTVLRTRRGELSVAPVKVELLSKSLRPLPEKFHGLSDTETRYRRRYVDLIVNPDVRDTFAKRFAIIAAIRRFMDAAGYLEVETPMLHPIPGGATAKPFTTHHNALDMQFYLRIAPELYLKRLLVGGFERVYEINRSFRNEGISVRHNPEFTMLECYQAFGDLRTMMDLLEGLVRTVTSEVLGSTTVTYQGVEVDFGSSWRRATMIELTSEAAGEDVSFARTVDEMRGLCRTHEVPFEKAWGKGKLITELFEKLVERFLIQPTFVTDYPLETSPLARRKPDEPELTDRFELIVTGREIANAFSELVDPVDQRERFAAQMDAKASGDEEAMGYDEDYLRAMEYGMPPAGGMGIGIDRLVMLLTDSASIRDVLLFPHLREEMPTAAEFERTCAEFFGALGYSVTVQPSPTVPNWRPDLAVRDGGREVFVECKVFGGRVERRSLSETADWLALAAPGRPVLCCYKNVDPPLRGLATRKGVLILDWSDITNPWRAVGRASKRRPGSRASSPHDPLRLFS